LGLPTPVNEALQRTATRFARDHRSPGTLTPAERAELLAAAGQGH
jgi:hypothetical protein